MAILFVHTTVLAPASVFTTPCFAHWHGTVTFSGLPPAFGSYPKGTLGFYQVLASGAEAGLDVGLVWDSA